MSCCVAYSMQPKMGKSERLYRLYLLNHLSTKHLFVLQHVSLQSNICVLKLWLLLGSRGSIPPTIVWCQIWGPGPWRWHSLHKKKVRIFQFWRTMQRYNQNASSTRIHCLPCAPLNFTDATSAGRTAWTAACNIFIGEQISADIPTCFDNIQSGQILGYVLTVWASCILILTEWDSGTESALRRVYRTEGMIEHLQGESGVRVYTAAWHCSFRTIRPRYRHIRHAIELEHNDLHQIPSGSKARFWCRFGWHAFSFGTE